MNRDNHFANEDANLRAQIQEICKFKDADIAENKHGRLTSSQKTRLMLTALAPFLGMMATLIGLIVVAVGLYYFGPLIARRIRLLIYVGKYLTIGLGALFLGLVAFIIKFLLASGRVFQLLSDMSDCKVTHVTGRLTTSQNAEVQDGIASFTRRKTETYCFVVRGEYFQVPRDAWELMRERDGGGYRVYVTPKSRFLVALEPAVSGVDAEARDPFKLEYKHAY